MSMKMLEAGGVPALIDNIREADIDNPNGYYEFEPVKKTKEDASWLNDAGGKVVKMVYKLLFDLPDDHFYRVVFIRRDLEETIASQNKMLERQGISVPSGADDQMRQLFVGELARADKWLQEQPNVRFVYVSYNEVLNNPGPEVLRINELFNGMLDTEAMEATVDRKLYRNVKT